MASPESEIIAAIATPPGQGGIGIIRISGNNQLIVKDLDREFLVPVVEAICVEIDIARKQIIIDAPEGLMDLD